MERSDFRMGALPRLTAPAGLTDIIKPCQPSIRRDIRQMEEKSLPKSGNELVQRCADPSVVTCVPPSG